MWSLTCTVFIDPLNHSMNCVEFEFCYWSFGCQIWAKWSKVFNVHIFCIQYLKALCFKLYRWWGALRPKLGLMARGYILHWALCPAYFVWELQSVTVYCCLIIAFSFGMQASAVLNMCWKHHMYLKLASWQVIRTYCVLSCLPIFWMIISSCREAVLYFPREYFHFFPVL